MSLDMSFAIEREDLRAIFDAAVAAVDPAMLVRRVVRPSEAGILIDTPGGGPAIELGKSICVVGGGKAARGMAGAFEEAAGDVVAVEGVVVAPAGDEPSREARRVRVLPGEHPVPGSLGESGTAQVLDRIRSTSADTVVCLLSGGASSLLVQPASGIRLSEKQEVTRLLLASGAAIGELNAVRKHLSAIKGGRLLEAAGGRRVVTLLISDVVGDDPSTIGSGPSCPDQTTFAEAIEVLRRYGAWGACPAAVTDHLEKGLRGEVPETVRADSAAAERCTTVLLATNRTALRAAKRYAESIGYAVDVDGGTLTGDTRGAAESWSQRLIDDRTAGPRCWLAGGETTVVVRGDGLGGRNQEFALASVDRLDGEPIAILSAGTDGIDGPTDAAGAFVDGETRQRCRDLGMAPEGFLASNDSYRFFERLGDLLVTGPTGTNVMDIKIAVRR